MKNFLLLSIITLFLSQPTMANPPVSQSPYQIKAEIDKQLDREFGKNIVMLVKSGYTLEQAKYIAAKNKEKHRQVLYELYHLNY